VRNVYVLQVQVTDNGPGTLSSVAAMTVRLTDIGEAPTVTGLFLLNVNENSAVGTTVGTITANDVDAADSSNLKYTFSQAIHSVFHWPQHWYYHGCICRA
jgi:hypothetical protein